MPKINLICHCGKSYTARQADLDRGWGLSCSKSCAATKRGFGRPKARSVESEEPDHEIDPEDYGHIFMSGCDGHG